MNTKCSDLRNPGSDKNGKMSGTCKPRSDATIDYTHKHKHTEERARARTIIVHGYWHRTEPRSHTACDNPSDPAVTGTKSDSTQSSAQVELTVIISADHGRNEESHTGARSQHQRPPLLFYPHYCSPSSASNRLSGTFAGLDPKNVSLSDNPKAA